MSEFQYVPKLFDIFESQYPASLQGIREAEAVRPDRFREILEKMLGWAVRANGEKILEESAGAFVDFSMAVNLAQARYERAGHYQSKSFEEVYQAHYADNEAMRGYLWGIYLTNMLWAHHTDILYFFLDRFVAKLPETAHILEVAPGHGGWGLLALDGKNQASLEGYDISPESIAIATRLATDGAGFGDRARYEERDALSLSDLTPESVDGFVCSFLLEHLEKPEAVFEVAAHTLKPGGIGFITGALTAAQVDHIYEFLHESELVLMAEDVGLRVVETLSANPVRRLKGARFVPRSMGMIVQKP